MDKGIEALNPVCVPKRIVRNWATSVMRHCDYCSHYKDTVLNDDGSAICATCCDAEHSGNLQCALEDAIQRNAELIAALEQAQRNAMRYQFIRDKDAFGDESEPGLIGWDRLVELDANEFDAAIDARMAHPGVAYTPSPNGMMQLSNELAEMKRKCVELTVWYGPMPESNGKTNWTAILHRKGESLSAGITIDRSEYPDRVRYEADRMRYLIGELDEKPWITNYDANKHSGYTARKEGE